MPFTFKPAAVVFLTVFLFAGVAARAMDDYVPGPDSMPQEGVPKGELTKYRFDHSRIFPGTTRDYWVYVPHEYDPAKPACLYVGQDGVQFRATNVFDNLIARHEMPVTIGVFIMHGRVKAESTNALDRFNRSYEYDGLGDNYARFLLDEILPEVETKSTADGRPIRFSKDPNDRAIGGSSSGAICAFTAAWERPDSFRRIFSSIGTFVDQRGGNDYPSLIRKTEAKPLRIFLQDGANDLNIVGGNWHLANEEMLSALEFADYQVNHIWGDGAHNGKQATAIFPDAMRWLWKDWPSPVEVGTNSRQPVARILIPGESWQLLPGIAGNGIFSGGAKKCAGHSGNAYSLAKKNSILLIDSRGKKTVVDKGISFSGLCLAPDQSLLLASDSKGQFVYSFHINPDGTLADRQPYFHLRIPDGVMESGAAGMAVDTRGTLYVATHLGIQMCDQAGRVQGIISDPPGVEFSEIAFGGPQFDELLAKAGAKVFQRKLKVTGVSSLNPPIKPAAPSL